ncbi:DMT family transporter [Breoghania sp. L-A4]|uniref:DMT family transporter n=1 Tax=Breoghania sp. L-A4 TaxID=2304600 RepID=UPI000E35C3A5|nr:DMT family transporter [Breoghania sp. L-A4]AXS42077.1 DMT family transporter [Breoghania sp. L-A4]
MTRSTANALLLLAAVIWGSGFVAQSTAMDTLDPFTFTGLRFLIAATVFAPFALFEARRDKAARQPDARSGRVAGISGAQAMLFVGIGVVFFGANIAQQIGLVTTSVTNAGFLTGLYVVIVPVLALLVFGERPHAAVWPASLMTLAGVWLLGGGRLDALNWGDGAVIACALFWALHVLLLGRTGAETGRPMALCVVQFVVVAVLGLGAGAVAGGPALSVDALETVWFELFYTGVIDGGVAFGIQAVAQRWTRSSDAAVLLSSEALFAALFGAWLLGERLDAAAMAGCALILTAIVLVQLAPGLRLARA